MDRSSQSSNSEDNIDSGRNNRIFIIIALFLGGVLLIALMALAFYAILILPKREQSQQTQVAEIQATNTALYLSNTQTEQAKQFSPTPTYTPTQTPTTTLKPTVTFTPLPSPTSTPREEATSTQPARTPTPTPTVTLPSSIPESYAIHKGEFIYCLARRYDIHPDDLLELNNLTRRDKVYPGDIIKIPEQYENFPVERALKEHPAEFAVQEGDETPYSVACLFGDVYPQAIAQLNDIKVDQKLKIGQVLLIP